MRLIQLADIETLAFSKTLYRRSMERTPESSFTNSVEEDPKQEVARILSKCRVAYRLSHWVNGDVYLDMKIRGSNVSNECKIDGSGVTRLREL